MPFKLANVGGRAALVAGDSYYDLEKLSEGSIGSDPMAALEDLPALSALSATLADSTPTGALADAELGPPTPLPPSCFAVGLNYKNHAEESKLDIPPTPMIFTKYSSCLVGPTTDVVLSSDYVDYEAELVAVIGKGGKNIAKENAWDHVAGLCIGQDISDRARQLLGFPPQFNIGKSFDTFGPMGPYLVSVDSLEPGAALQLECKINDEVKQNDNTGDLIFDIPTLIAYVSELCTLRVGDVIFTGTPGGVGVADANFLRDGDTITTTIEGLGTMTNRCVRVADHSNSELLSPRLKEMLEQAKSKA
ncbi:MAG: fumarylacetoacetate hydrolase family protein [Pseudomonadales bacterium]